jgi:hypothetical protein
MKKYFFTETGELTDLHKNLHSLIKIGLAVFIAYKLN